MVLLCLEIKFLVSVLFFSLIMLKSDLKLLSAFILLNGAPRRVKMLVDVCNISYSIGVVKSSCP